MIKPLFNCNALMVDVQSYSSLSGADTSTPPLTYNGQGQVTNSWSYNPGTLGQVVIVRLIYQWSVVGGPLADHAVQSSQRLLGDDGDLRLSGRSPIHHDAGAGAPSAKAFRTSVPRRIPRSSMTAMLLPTASRIGGSARNGAMA